MQTSVSVITRARWATGLTSVAVLFTGMPISAMAQTTNYTDVPSGAYYEEAAAALLRLGALDRSETRLRPSDSATRAEMVKLLVNLNDKQLLYPAQSSFSDVAKGSWYAPYFEAAGVAGWIRGDDNCYPNDRTCKARPQGSINRAEAATLLVRAFDLRSTGKAPDFTDNPQNQWYHSALQIAADHCVLQGDANSRMVRPSSFMNRAEMVVMFNRAHESQLYGTDCGEVIPVISGVSVLSATHIRVQFSEAVQASQAENIVRYTVKAVSGNDTVAVRSANIINDHTVELELGTLDSGVSYALTVKNLLSKAGVLFTHTERFMFEGRSAQVTSVTAQNATTLRLAFDEDVKRSNAEEETRYSLHDVTDGGTVGIDAAILVSSRLVELRLSSSMHAGTSYRVDVQHLLTDAGVDFSDTANMVFSPETGDMSNVVVLSSTRLRLEFDSELDSARAVQSARYVVTDGTNNFSFRTPELSSDRRSVELSLNGDLQAQRAYTVRVDDLLTAGGALFKDSGSFVYGAVTASLSATLTGAQEVPAAFTSATGLGTFILTTTGLQYDITVQNLSTSITGAHIHSGAMGSNGPVLSTLTFTANRSTGTWTGITTAQRNAMLNGEMYVNVHTSTYPDGEIRGQILKP